jgi:ribonuclease E
MANKMLIDASHPEETRVVVLRGNRVEEFDFESASRKQLRGNIYLAKVTRVEPSLQAAFVDYGGNRHGFLAFSEIHPDYYQIPIADRQALIEEEERAQRAADAEAENRAGRRRGRHRSSRRRDETIQSEPIAGEPGDEENLRLTADLAGGDAVADQEHAADIEAPVAAEATPAESEAGAPSDRPETSDAGPFGGSGYVAAAEPIPEAPVAVAEPPTHEDVSLTTETPAPAPAAGTLPDRPLSAADSSALEHESHAADARGEHHGSDGEHEAEDHHEDDAEEHDEQEERVRTAESGDDSDEDENENGNGEDSEAEEEVVESVGGGDALEEVQERMARPRRQYKIQEVIKRRQVMLVQVVKEERGTKGAALTTYLSLAGRYSVLMPNTARGGGISRKITSAEDRRRLKDIAQDLEVPEGMGVILRTAGASRTKTEVKRDFEYLMRLWETVRDLTLKSTAPTLVYEEGSLVKRAIRDLYNKDIDDIMVAGDEAYRDAKDFMRMLMPSHAKNVKPYKDTQPLFTRYGIESQLDAMFSPIVQLRSGGYIVLNQTEALVAIDVNSGRATREHHIEDTALKTNVEAAEEIARQLRLRDLAGLIVIDFIDMDEKRNNRTVERRLKEALKHDRARIQVGRISHFGLMEMSRQRIRSSVLESSTDKCPECGGTGHVRSVSSVALQLLRAVEETLIKSATHCLIVRTRSDVALYVLNHKRAHLRALEERFKLTITVNADETVTGSISYVIDRGEQVHTPEAAKALVAQPASFAPELEPEEPEETEEIGDAEEPADGESEREAAEGDENGRRRKRRRRRRRGGEQTDAEQPAMAAGDDGATDDEDEAEGEAAEAAEATPTNGDGDPRRRRRGRRGRRGGRRERGEDEDTTEHGTPPAEFAPEGESVDPLAGVAPPQPEGEPYGAPQAFVEFEPAVPSRGNVGSAPPVAEAAAPSAEAPAAPRRRSTVREPAPVFGEQEAAPVPSSFTSEPVAEPAPAPEPATAAETASAAADDNRQRRTGWWSRKMMGGG